MYRIRYIIVVRLLLLVGCRPMRISQSNLADRLKFDESVYQCVYRFEEGGVIGFLHRDDSYLLEYPKEMWDLYVWFVPKDGIGMLRGDVCLYEFGVSDGDISFLSLTGDRMALAKDEFNRLDSIAEMYERRQFDQLPSGVAIQNIYRETHMMQYDDERRQLGFLPGGTTFKRLQIW